MSAIDHEQFICELYQRFPAVRDEIDPEIEGGLLHLEVSAFTRLTLQAIEATNRDAVTRCFQFAERLLVHGDNAVKNAVYVSYLENLEFAEESQLWAADLMPRALLRAWFEIQEYMDKISGTNIALRLKDRR